MILHPHPISLKHGYSKHDEISGYAPVPITCTVLVHRTARTKVIVFFTVFQFSLLFLMKIVE